MPANYPTPQQQRILWAAITGLAIAALVGVVLLGMWLLGHVFKIIYPVLLPLGVAAIIAYILDPVLEWLEKALRLSRRVSLFVLLLGVIITAVLFLVLLVPPLAHQAMQFASSLPDQIKRSHDGILSFLDAHADVKAWVDTHLTPVLNTLPTRMGEVLTDLGTPVHQVFAWLGAVLGFLFVPIFVYYFLLEKQQIADNWKQYLPLHRSWWRDEVVVVLSEINNYLIIFFRGQVIVGMCIGVLTIVGLSLIGLPYALLIGLLAGALSLIPYLGIICTLLPALLVGYSNARNATEMWLNPVLVLSVFATVHLCESLFISPRIMGDRTGLHPATVIISILTWSLLLPGLLGPILAVPLTATLRVLMYRYVWLNVTDSKTS